MSRIPRLQSESGFYHIFSRGNGRQIIFEDENDRQAFLRCLDSALTDFDTELYAYCLMGNHYHLVVQSDYANLPSFAHKLNCSYAIQFNDAHERVGHLFQDRYRSQPINDDSHLLSAIRYVHRNPVEAHLAPTCNYRWSSYPAYLGATDNLVSRSTGKVLEMLGGVEAFKEFHSHSGRASFIDDAPIADQMSEAEMIALARDALNGFSPSGLKSLRKPDRDRGLRLLKATSMSLTQIALVTGIGRTTIHRA